ncbi:MAG TPA: class I SAM-dependent methyltransferase [Candidatus Obscuribacterales bacterium]
MSASFQNLFDKQSADYARYRPSYPRELFEFIAFHAPGTTRAWDAGCGSGQAAVALAEFFDEVIATDSSAAQIEHAIANPKVKYKVVASETCELPSHSCDVVTAANALHWFDIPKFFAEAKRVLKPGGIIAVWCYTDVQASDKLKPLIDELKEKIRPYWPAPIKIVADRYRSLEFPFEEVEMPPIQMQTHWNIDRCLGYVSTWSAVEKYRAATGSDPVAELRATLPPAVLESNELYTITFPLPARIGKTSL